MKSIFVSILLFIMLKGYSQSFVEHKLIKTNHDTLWININEQIRNEQNQIILKQTKIKGLEMRPYYYRPKFLRLIPSLQKRICYRVKILKAHTYLIQTADEDSLISTYDSESKNTIKQFKEYINDQNDLKVNCSKSNNELFLLYGCQKHRKFLKNNRKRQKK